MDKITRPSKRLFYFLLTFLEFSSLCCASALWAKPAPKYMDAVQQEISRLGMSASCQETTGACTITLAPQKNEPNSSNAIEPISITVDDASKTIRIAIEEFLSTETLIFETAKRLLELNHKLVVAKFSINPERKSISLSAIVNTDSNFDRKTFRSVLKGFVQTARVLKKELENQN